jgi:hypothetical protein
MHFDQMFGQQTPPAILSMPQVKIAKALDREQVLVSQHQCYPGMTAHFVAVQPCSSWVKLKKWSCW